ncbi:MAG: hydroxyphenylacetyl-CoA thioesterase PaaI [Gemmatimonadaceae bacterium]|nr:hydroxyphenylacetyl-CoA thioesterase PaaI [Acetobacteraceae bacterium]
MSAQALAERCAEAMWASDHASQGLGIAIEHIAPGAARLSMTVAPQMLNGHGTCHGGFIFALADSAFAFACNTDGMVSVASQCSIVFLRPAGLGERLVAVAEERHRKDRSGIYDVRVTAGAEVVAEFRGHSRTTGARMADGS